MLMLVAFALRCAGIAYPRAQLEHFAQHLLVRPCPPHRELARRLAHVGAVEADADALPHVHLFRGAGIGAAEAHPRAIHEVVRRIAERLVDVPGNVRVKGDHLADGHRFSLAGQTCG